MTHIVGFFSSIPFVIGIVLFLILYVLQTPILTFPIYFLMFYAGLIYGLWIGAIVNIFGMFLSTTIGYFVGSLGKMDKLLQHSSMEKFDLWIKNNGFKSIVFLRIIPIIPYNVTSIGSGMLKLNQKKYLAVNTLAIVPYSIIWTILGDLFGVVLINRLHFKLDYSILVPTILVIFLIGIFYVFIKKRYIDH